MSTRGQVAARDYYLLYQRKRDLFCITGKHEMPSQNLLERKDTLEVRQSFDVNSYKHR